MISKIFKYNYFDYNIYYKLIGANTFAYPTKGLILKYNCAYLRVGVEYSIHVDSSTEISEQDYNKIMVFE